MEIKSYYRKSHPWVVKALERDGFKCRECGSEESLVVHHKDESRKTGKLNNKLSNLITLCRYCHAEIHKQTLRFVNPSIGFIKELRDQGKTFKEIGVHLGISRQRVHQIYKKI